MPRKSATLGRGPVLPSVVVMPARFARLLVVGMVVLPSTAHSTLPPAPGGPRGPAAFAPRPIDAGPAFAPRAIGAGPAFAPRARDARLAAERRTFAATAAERFTFAATAPAARDAGEGGPRAPSPPRAFAPDAGPEREACAKRESLRQLQGKIDPAVIRAATDHLELPMGSGHYLSVNGRPYLFCLEPHYREPGSGPGPQGWHKGVTAYEAGE